MKNRNKQRFDYSKEPKNEYGYEEYGLHMRNHELHIDTKRLKIFVDRDLFPELFDAPRNTHYFIPKHRYIDDYKINQVMSTLNWLEYEWTHTYRGYYASIKHPKEVYEDRKMYELNQTCDSESFDDICSDAIVEAIKAAPLYQQRVLDLYFVYIEKIQQEFFNTWTYIADQLGYNQTDFTFGKFLVYFNGRIQGRLQAKGDTKAKDYAIEKLPHFKYFDFLNRVVNFVKHKTIRSYESIAFIGGPRDKNCPYRDEFRKYVTKTRYRNGAPAIPLLDLPPKYIEETIDNLKEFAKEICALAFDEDYEEARWNSQEYIFKTLTDFLR